MTTDTEEADISMTAHTPKQDNALQEERAIDIGLMFMTLHPSHGRSRPEREQMSLGCEGRSWRVQRRGGKRDQRDKRKREAVLLFPHQGRDPCPVRSTPSPLGEKYPG